MQDVASQPRHQAVASIDTRLSSSHPTRPLTAAADAASCDPRSRPGFCSMRAAFAATGGIARGDDVARQLEDHGVGDYIGLARLISRGDVFGFDWCGALWIPMFQFDAEDLSVRPAARLVLEELGPGFDGWQRAAWLARPNPWLANRAPVDVLDAHLTEVLAAARTDRFIAIG